MPHCMLSCRSTLNTHRTCLLVQLLLLQLAKLFVVMYPRQPATAAIARAVEAILKEERAGQGSRQGAAH